MTPPSSIPRIFSKYSSYSSSKNVYFSILAIPDPIVNMHRGSCAMYRYFFPIGSIWCRKKNISSITQMSDLSTSVIMHIFLYRSARSSSSNPLLPSPHANISPLSSLF